MKRRRRSVRKRNRQRMGAHLRRLAGSGRIGQGKLALG